MSIDGTKLLFEGFLQKRKDTMKIRWVTYWFRLQNTTLFFYTQKNGSASHLRGYYYIYTVQSVREVQRVDSKRFMFEIIMTNGKRKVLAAETAALRKEWVGRLWQAMNLSTSVVSDSKSTHLEVCEQRDRLNSSAPICSHRDSVKELLPARPLSAPAPTGHIHPEIRSIASPICLSEAANIEEATHQNTLPSCIYQLYNGDSLDSSQWSSGLNNAEGRQEGDYDILPLRNSDSLISSQWSSGLNNAECRQEGDYDILPLRNKVCEINASTEMDEGVYDFPLSYRRTAQHPNPTESIYDVPGSLLRRMPDNTIEEQPEDGVYWSIRGPV